MLHQIRLSRAIPIVLALVVAGCGVADSGATQAPTPNTISAARPAGQATATIGPEQGQNTASSTDSTPQTLEVSNPEVQPMPNDQPGSAPAQQPQSSAPGQAPSGEGANPQSPAASLPASQASDPATWQGYADDAGRFRISYPAHYSIKTMSEAERSTLSPVPLSGLQFQDERGEVAAIAPPQLSILIFKKDAGQSLEDWLKASGKLSANSFAEPYQGKHVTGIKVTSATLIAPGSSVFVVHDELVFQITPLGQEGEQMLDTLQMT